MQQGHSPQVRSHHTQPHSRLVLCSNAETRRLTVWPYPVLSHVFTPLWRLRNSSYTAKCTINLYAARTKHVASSAFPDIPAWAWYRVEDRCNEIR